MRYFLKMLAILYLIGALLHLGDVLDMRLQLSNMNAVWRIWIWYLLVLDLAASVGLWYEKFWGQVLFLLIAGSQLIAYIGFRTTFGDQWELVGFHIVTVTIYFALVLWTRFNKKF